MFFPQIFVEPLPCAKPGARHWVMEQKTGETGRLLGAGGIDHLTFFEGVYLCVTRSTRHNLYISSSSYNTSNIDWLLTTVAPSRTSLSAFPSITTFAGLNNSLFPIFSRQRKPLSWFSAFKLSQEFFFKFHHTWSWSFGKWVSWGRLRLLSLRDKRVMIEKPPTEFCNLTNMPHTKFTELIQSKIE